MQEEIDELKRNRNKTEIDKRKSMSEKSSSQLVFNAQEDKMIKFNSENDSVEIDSEYKFITTDVIENSESLYKKVWDSVRKAFSGRECIAYWRYPIFSKRGENNKEPDITIIDRELEIIVLEVLDYKKDDILNAQYDRWDLKNGSSASPIYDAEDKSYSIKGLYYGNRKIRGIKETAAVVVPQIERLNWLDDNSDDQKDLFKSN